MRYCMCYWCNDVHVCVHVYIYLSKYRCVRSCATGEAPSSFTYTCLYTGVLGLVRPARHHPLYEVSQDAGAHAGQPQRKEAASGSHSLGYGSGMSEVEEAGPGNRFDWLRERQEMQERVCACVSVCVCARARECVCLSCVICGTLVATAKG